MASKLDFSKMLSDHYLTLRSLFCSAFIHLFKDPLIQSYLLKNY